MSVKRGCFQPAIQVHRLPAHCQTPLSARSSNRPATVVAAFRLLSATAVCHTVQLIATLSSHQVISHLVLVSLLASVGCSGVIGKYKCMHKTTTIKTPGTLKCMYHSKKLTPLHLDHSGFLLFVIFWRAWIVFQFFSPHV